MSVPDAPALLGPISGMGPVGPASSGNTNSAPPAESKAANPGAPSAGTPAAPGGGESGLSNIQPIPIKKTLMIVNNFVINTADFINKFAVLSERKLNKISQSIQRLEIVLAILEAKLASIEWLAGAPQNNAAPVQQPAANAVQPQQQPSGVPAPVEGTPASTSEVKDAPAPKPVNTTPLQEDARFRTYFKMLKLGVPKQQLRMKMQSEGVDPNIIDLDPEGPAPPNDDDAGGGKDADPGAANASASGNANANANGGGQLVKVEKDGSGSDSD